MPRRPEWIHRLEEALAQLELLTIPTVDRQTLEVLLGVSPRQALRILNRLAPHEAGQALVIGREELAAKLRAWSTDPDVRFERQRHGRVSEALGRARAAWQSRQMVIAPPPPPGSSGPALENLSTGIRLTPGRLEITFESGEELLGRLMELAQAVAEDPDRFQRATTRRPEHVE